MTTTFAIIAIHKYKGRKSHCMHFALFLSVAEMLIFHFCDLANIGQGGEVKQSEWCHSVGNIKVHKSHIMHVFASSHH